MKNRFAVSIAAVVLVVLTAGCTTVSGIGNSPQHYAGKSVRIGGTVTRVLNVPLIGFSLYEFTDRTGSVTVVSGEERVKGESFVLRGKVAAFPASAADSAARETIDAVVDFLLENELAAADKAESAAQSVYGVIERAVRALGGIYFIVEE